MATIPNVVLDEIEQLKSTGKYEKALKKVNTLLVRDPSNKEALYQVADIEYRRGEIMKAEKPVDFLLHTDADDAMGYYIKGVLEMEKTHWSEAKKCFKKALEMIDGDNPEILRCMGLSEYWAGNREEGNRLLIKSFKQNEMDAEVILNIIEISVLEKDVRLAQKYIAHYHANKKELQCFDRDIAHYDNKIELFEAYLKA